MSAHKFGTANKSQLSFDSGDEPLCGFLNRKHDVDCLGKRAKDRAWSLLWCSLKKNSLEFYKVDGIMKQPDEPPPKDTLLSPNQDQQKHKIGFFDVLNAKAEIDYTSQMNKDISKRRKHLFRVIWANGAHDLFQASTEIQRNHWVQVLNRAAIPHTAEEDSDGPRLHLVSLESRLKTARCSVTRKTKHTVDSLTDLSGTPMMNEDMNAEISSADLKLRLQALKSLLQKKRELLKQLNRMNSSFHGDITSMYSESAQSPGSPKLMPSVPLLDEEKRYSLPIMMPSEDSDSDKRSSMEDSSNVSFIHHSASQYNYPCDRKGVETTLLSDFYLIPGAEWSLLKAHETVRVLGLLPNGWYRCVATRDALMTHSSVAIAHERVDSTGDSSSFQDTSEPPDSMATKDRPGSEEFVMDDINATGSGLSQNDDNENITTLKRFTEKDVPLRNTDRNVSYRIATRRNHVDSTSFSSFSDSRDSMVRISMSDSLPRLSITSSIYNDILAGPGNSPLFDQLIEGSDRLAELVAIERSRELPSLPLVGCLPPSVLAGFADKSRDRFPPLPAASQRGSVPSPVLPDDYGAEEVPPSPGATTPTATSPPVAINVSSSIPSIVSSEFVPSSAPAIMGSKFVPPGPIPEVYVVSGPTPEPSLATSTPDLCITSSSSMDSILPLITSSASMDLASVRSVTPLLGVEEGSPEGSVVSELLSESTRETLLKPGRAALDRRKSDGGQGRKSTARGMGASPQAKGGGANALDSKPSFLKKLFGKKKSLPPPNDHASRRSSSPSILEGEMRPRLASQSGQLVTVVGGAVLIGESDTSDEEDGEEGIPKDSQMKRSSSEHSNLKSTTQTEGSPSYNPLTKKQSLKGLVSPTGTSPSPLALAYKSPLRNNSCVFDTLDSSKINSIFRTPPKGERRKVTLPRNEPKYGFRLETYTPYSKRTVKQTFVQSVNPGSPAFLAGLFAGDMIVEVDGMNVSQCSVEEVVKMFKAEKAGETMIQMSVVFVDGLTRLDIKKKAEALRKELRQKQQKLKELLEKEKATHPATSPMATPPVTTPMATPPVTTPMTTHPTNASTTSFERVCAETPTDAHQPVVSINKGWIMWEESVASAKPNGPLLYQYNSHLNKSIVLVNGEVNTLSCDVMVMPSSSCWTSVITAKQNNAMYQYLRHGGSGLWDELSSIKQGKLGDVLSTGGHGLPVRRIYHCLIGRGEDSAQLCVGEALRLARNEGHLTVALWVDGFAFAQVPPDMLVESVRQWLAEDRNGCCFHHVIFSCSTFFSDTETQLERYFPHQQLDPSDTQGDSGQSDSMSDDGSCSPEGIQEAPVAKDKPLAARLTSTVEPKDQGNQQFDIMPGALQSDV